MNARRAIFECISGFAMRREGVPGPNYIHPDVAGRASVHPISE